MYIRPATQQRFKKIQDRINIACQQANRDKKSIQLIAASKMKSAQDIRELYSLGQFHYGENYVSEAIEKQTKLSDLQLTWHYIGQIQSNKTKTIANAFDWVHGVDRKKIATRLNDHALKRKTKLNVLIQVNLDNEPTKAGVLLDDVQDLAKEIVELSNLSLRGLMALPQPRSNLEEQRACLELLKKKLEQINRNLGINLDTISAGMSNDLEAAIMAGSTMIRVGTDLFGPRS